MNNEHSSNYDEDFMGEHFEALGDVWHAIFGKDGEIASHLNAIIAEGNVQDDCTIKHDGKAVVLIQYPDDSPMKTGVLLAENQDNYEFVSCFPIFEGISNKVTIVKSHTWENGLEGTVAASAYKEDIGIITFFAPYYFKDCLQFAENSIQNINLSALAFTCELASQDDISISKGPLYEEMLKDFLQNNPGKTKNDYPATYISLHGSKILVPSHYVPEFDYRCPVLEVKQTSFFDKTVYVLYVRLIGQEDYIYCNLYVPERLLNGYIPRVGDDIQGRLWMSGILG